MVHRVFKLIGLENETAFSALHPKDHSANSAGQFPCGRYANAYETKEFQLPEDLSCDKCTIQLAWETPNFTNYHCSDITVMSEEVKSCMDKCEHGGACVNGRCVCPDMYYGTHCENKSKQIKLKN
jgi:hypothetical protein